MRTQCKQCPWRHVEDEVPPDVVEYAKGSPDGFVCHVRLGPCPGPRLALKGELR